MIFNNIKRKVRTKVLYSRCKFLTRHFSSILFFTIWLCLQCSRILCTCGRHQLNENTEYLTFAKPKLYEEDALYIGQVLLEVDRDANIMIM